MGTPFKSAFCRILQDSGEALWSLKAFPVSGLCGWLSKLWSLFGPYYDTAPNSRVPKKDPNFDNHPCWTTKTYLFCRVPMTSALWLNKKRAYKDVGYGSLRWSLGIRNPIPKLWGFWVWRFGGVLNSPCETLNSKPLVFGGGDLGILKFAKP